MTAHNHAAEQAVLGAALLTPEVIDDLADIISPADFYQPNHETIWTAVLAVHRSGRRPEPVLIVNQLGADAEKVGGLLYLYELVSPATAPVAASAPHYANLVLEAAITRRLITATIEIRQRAEAATDIRIVAEDARGIIDDAVSQAREVAAGIDSAALVSETIDSLDSGIDPGIATGWPDLDRYVNGLRPGQLAIVGARPSVGKSVIAANVAAAACRADVGVHFASLEMTRSEVMSRMFSAHATVDLSKLMNHDLSENDWERLSPKSAEISKWPLWVDDTQAQSLAQLRSRARTTARRKSLGLIVVDYLQLMAPRSRQVPREQQVGELSEGLKALAKELRVPVMALAQVNRGSAERRDQRPMMSDLRESGRIEADADHVWLLHRQDLVDPNSTTGEIEVHIAKNRNGASGQTVPLMFFGHYSRASSRAWSPTGAIA